MNKYSFKFDRKNKSFSIESVAAKVTFKNIEINNLNVTYPNKIKKVFDIKSLSYNLTLEDKFAKKANTFSITNSDALFYLYEYVEKAVYLNNLLVPIKNEEKMKKYGKIVYSSLDKAFTSFRKDDYFDKYDILVFLDKDGFTPIDTVLKINIKSFSSSASKNSAILNLINMEIEDYIPFKKELDKLFGYLIEKANTSIENKIRFNSNNKKIIEKNEKKLLEYIPCVEDRKERKKIYLEEGDICDLVTVDDIGNMFLSYEKAIILKINKDTIIFDTYGLKQEIKYTNIFKLKKRIYI